LRLVAESWLVLTDSGGLQEEAPSFRRPVLVLRERTERTEGVASGASRLVGTDARKIVQEVMALLRHPAAYARMVPNSNPYGDGKAAARIVQTIAQNFATKQRELAA
jgi:UDP-N-acetylglucosamine 2-epimerase (non-hydrolysing)